MAFLHNMVVATDGTTVKLETTSGKLLFTGTLSHSSNSLAAFKTAFASAKMEISKDGVLVQSSPLADLLSIATLTGQPIFLNEQSATVASVEAVFEINANSYPLENGEKIEISFRDVPSTLTNIAVYAVNDSKESNQLLKLTRQTCQANVTRTIVLDSNVFAAALDTSKLIKLEVTYRNGKLVNLHPKEFAAMVNQTTQGKLVVKDVNVSLLNLAVQPFDVREISSINVTFNAETTVYLRSV